ncbi:MULTISPECIES: hypothetical protein [unclassified Nocardioides]|uniref:hypothetical protein n=1 Tax=unclassified Nocardioides TaxID=2615069 RepID=UPI003014BDDB
MTSRLVPVLTLVGVLAAGVLTVGLLGVDTSLRVAGAAVLLAVALAAAGVAAASLVLRRRLGELRHLPDLGRHFVTRHEGARVTGISHDEGGVTLLVASEEVQTMVLDESGTPDHVSGGGPGTSRWRIPGTARLSDAQAGSVEALLTEATPVRVVSSGVVGLAGPVATGWRLEARNGLVLSSGL